MNSNVKGVIIFISGAVVGSISTYLAVRKVFELKADEEVASVKKAYQERIDYIDITKNSLDGELEGPETIEEDVKKQKSTSSIVRDLNNKPPLKDYTKYFKGSGSKDLELKEVVRDARGDAIAEGEIDPAEMEGPEDDEPYTDEEDKEEQINYEDYELNGAHKSALELDRAPYEIDRSDFELTCSQYDKIPLLYYVSDDVLAEETGEEVEPEGLIGDVLITSGFCGNEEDILLVRNDKLTSDFEVTKVYTNYRG